MNKLTFFFFTSLCFTAFSLSYAEDQEIQEADQAQSEYDEQIAAEQKQMEDAIERARNAYLAKAIQIKKKYVYELKKAVRIAEKAGRIENAEIIQKQIDSVLHEIAALENGELEPAKVSDGGGEAAYDSAADQTARNIKRPPLIIRSHLRSYRFRSSRFESWGWPHVR